MIDKIEEIRKKIDALQPKNAEEVEEFRLKYLTKKGLIPSLFKDFKDVPPEQKKEIGQALNQLKTYAQMKYNQWKEELGKDRESKAADIDFSLPANFVELGARHPISI
ncbi:MAG: phenylalanine--tRNA ligase subunit alpha, partial [Bacteroidales bacterium]|nr:phenylalanine--tRNA ligase subunit alpha [Bacteroidales bacterium]